MSGFEHLQFRRGTAAQWAAINPVLEVGEPGFESDTGGLKVGDGETVWSGLDYVTTKTPNAGDFVAGFSRIRNPNLLDGIFRYNGGGGLIETNAFGTADEFYVVEWNGSNTLSAVDARNWLGDVDDDSAEAVGYWGDTLPAGTYFRPEAGLYRWTILIQLKVGATVEAGDVLYALMDTGTTTDGSFANNDTPPLFLASQPNNRLLQLGGTLYCATDGALIVPSITTDADTTLEEVQFTSVVLWKLQ